MGRAARPINNRGGSITGLRETWPLSLSGLAVGVPPIAVSLSSGFIFDQASHTAFFGCLTRFGFGAGRSNYGFLPLGRLGHQPLLLLKLYPLAFKTPLLPGRGHGHAFRLPRQPGRLGRRLRRAIGSQESRLCLRGCRAAIGKLGVSGVLQMSILGFGLK